jgi:hypothetical protein
MVRCLILGEHGSLPPSDTWALGMGLVEWELGMGTGGAIFKTSPHTESTLFVLAAIVDVAVGETSWASHVLKFAAWLRTYDQLLAGFCGCGCGRAIGLGALAAGLHSPFVGNQRKPSTCRVCLRRCTRKGFGPW